MLDLNDGRPGAHPIVFWACLVGTLGTIALVGLGLHYWLQ